MPGGFAGIFRKTERKKIGVTSSGSEFPGGRFRLGAQDSEPGSSGEVAERLKAAVSKTVVGVTPPGVQIPPSPPNILEKDLNSLSRLKGSSGSINGEVAERPKAHAWKACLGQPNVGSIPTLSAISGKTVESVETVPAV